MEQAREKLSSYALSLRNLLEESFFRLQLLTPEEVSRIDCVPIVPILGPIKREQFFEKGFHQNLKRMAREASCIDHLPIQESQAIEELNPLRMMVINTEKLVNKAITELFFLSESADVRDYLRQCGTDAIWRFLQFKKLVEHRLKPLFNSLVSPIGRSKLDINFLLDTNGLLFDYCDWLELLCEEPESDDSSLSDIEQVAETLTGQSHELFIRLARGRFVSFDDIKAESIVNSDDDEAVLKAIKRLKDKLVGTPYDLKQDTRRVRLERISPDK